ncbi:hypothetical protein Pcinc_034402 [Petrolisthes cinctipes]|uniref:3-beta hydroxysteroid dehydrogenase/isomerase domain-containing protein n=1 Tax=Petrolisthes cinctipes TaxID=88211 RepID=A0AAE1EQC3_PETCI|nr:hypothetical protein Pcinc_034402 [Petrolisthes cinctipes]
MMRVVVTGGGGYVGYHVGWVLSKGGHHVTLLDLTPPDPEWQVTAPLALHDALTKGFWGKEVVSAGPLEYVKGSVTCPGDLDTAFKGATGVIHTASCGVSGRQQLSPHDALVEEINVGGTREVIAAALRAQVRALVYTSTYNVVFGGEEIQGGDETMPTYPLHAHTDHYSRTKTVAEMLVLMADGKSSPRHHTSITCHASSLTPAPVSPPAPAPVSPVNPAPVSPPAPAPVSSLTPAPVSSLTPAPAPVSSPSSCCCSSSCCVSSCHSSTTLGTCSLRLNGVMGVGERRHTVRVLSVMRSGMMFFTFGRKDMLVDFVSIQNCVQAHVKALLALLYERGYPGDLPPLLRQHPTSTTDHDPNNEGQQQQQHQQQHDHKNYNDQQQQHDPKNYHDHQQYHPRNSDHPKQQQQQQHNTTQSVSVGLNSGPSLVSGEAFFINDAAPVNHFEYFRPWFQGLGYSFPSHALPLWIILLFAHLQHAVYKLVYRFFPFCPLFTPAETYKSGIRHYFSCSKAQECFGYAPTRPNDQTAVVKYLIDKGYNNKNNTGTPGQLVLVLGFILIALTLGYSLFTFLC